MGESPVVGFIILHMVTTIDIIRSDFKMSTTITMCEHNNPSNKCKKCRRERARAWSWAKPYKSPIEPVRAKKQGMLGPESVSAHEQMDAFEGVGNVRNSR